MKKYYDLPQRSLVACLDWEEGYGTLEQAQNYFKTKIREISKNEFDILGEKYCKFK